MPPDSEKTRGANSGCQVVCVCCRHSFGLTEQNFSQPEDKVKRQTLNRHIYFDMIFVTGDNLSQKV